HAPRVTVALPPVMLIRCATTLVNRSTLSVEQSGAHRRLHSFPTRRSSDLSQTGDFVDSVLGEFELDPFGREKGDVLPYQGVLGRSEEHTSELQSRENLVCRLLLE